MFYIYRFTNKTNGKCYVGQTNNIEKRKRGHKSESFNPKANGYNLAFHRAIRKYGWDGFDFEVLEEIDDSAPQTYVNEREIFFIAHNHSLVTEHGYNISAGGQGYTRRKKLGFEEQVWLSKIFTVDEVRKIQQMLIDGYEYFEILSTFPKLTDSFLSNINIGLNFVRQDLTYPLSTLHTRFTKQTKDEIIQAIKDNVPYSQISKKYGISVSYLSQINNGTRWVNKNFTYPLCKKVYADGAWSHEAKYDLIFTDLSHLKIGEKYGKKKVTITAINTGRNRKDDRFKYPLRKYQEENQKIWNTLF